MQQSFHALPSRSRPQASQDNIRMSCQLANEPASRQFVYWREVLKEASDQFHFVLRYPEAQKHTVWLC